METVGGPPVSAVLTGCRVLVTARRRADELAGALETARCRGGARPDPLDAAAADDTGPRHPHQGPARHATRGASWSRPATAFEEWLARRTTRGARRRPARHAGRRAVSWPAGPRREPPCALPAWSPTGSRRRTPRPRSPTSSWPRGWRAPVSPSCTTGAVTPGWGRRCPARVPRSSRWRSTGGGRPEDPARVAASARDLARRLLRRRDLHLGARRAVAWLEALGRRRRHRRGAGAGAGGRAAARRRGPGDRRAARLRRPHRAAADRARGWARWCGSSSPCWATTDRPCSRSTGRLRVRAGAITLDHRPVPLPPTGLAVLRRLGGDAGPRGHPRGAAARPAGGLAATRTPRRWRWPGCARPCASVTGEAGLVRTVIKRGYVLAAR